MTRPASRRTCGSTAAIVLAGLMAIEGPVQGQELLSRVPETQVEFDATHSAMTTVRADPNSDAARSGGRRLTRVHHTAAPIGRMKGAHLTKAGIIIAAIGIGALLCLGLALRNT